MAKVGSFLTNEGSITAGRWIKVNEDDEPFEIKARGFTNKYRNALSMLRRAKARMLNRQSPNTFTADNLPPAAEDECQAKALAEHCILDVRGLEWPDDEKYQGREVTGDEFRDLLQDELGRDLLVISLNAVMSISQDRQDDAEELAKNSLNASDGS